MSELRGNPKPDTAGTAAFLVSVVVSGDLLDAHEQAQAIADFAESIAEADGAPVDVWIGDPVMVVRP